MKLRVYSTTREIRELFDRMDEGFLDHKPIALGEFLRRSILVEDKHFIDEDLRRIYLFEAMKEVDVAQLGIEREFLDFIKSGEKVYGFFKELFLENVAIEEIAPQDTYAEYDEHLQILDAWLKRYKALLSQKGLVDDITIDDFRINENYLNQFDLIEIELHGYISRFHRKILDNISQPIEIDCVVTPFNRTLFKKMFDLDLEPGRYRYDYHRRSIIDRSPSKGLPAVEISAFGERIDQVHFVLASIEEFVQDGADPNKIAVILPDETFGLYLQLFNEPHNLNFAFGTPFRRSDFFLKLQALCDYMVKKDEKAYEKIKDIWSEYEKIDDFNTLLDYLFTLSNEREKILLEEEFFKIKRLLSHIPKEKKAFMHFLMDRLGALSFDDVGGGKITVMGVLESRGVMFDGIIVVDFNEEYIPKVGESDFFINSTVRKRVGLPTRYDKEALQKSYYYQLFSNSERVRLSYVKNDETSASRFLYELGFDDGTMEDDYYTDVAFTLQKQPSFYSYEGQVFQKPRSFSPTSLSTLLECSKKYYLSYVLKIKNDLPESEEIFGSRLHTVLEEVVKKRSFATPTEYADRVIEGLIHGLERAKRFEILTKWEERIHDFCNKDFERAKMATVFEEKASKKLGSVTLEAKCDRMDIDFVYDYKTGKPSAKDEIQRLFYNYIFEKEAIFYYIKEKKVQLDENKSHEEAKEELMRMIDSITCVVKKSEDISPCQWCDYKFVCRR